MRDKKGGTLEAKLDFEKCYWNTDIPSHPSEILLSF